MLEIAIANNPLINNTATNKIKKAISVFNASVGIASGRKAANIDE